MTKVWGHFFRKTYENRGHFPLQTKLRTKKRSSTWKYTKNVEIQHFDVEISLFPPIFESVLDFSRKFPQNSRTSAKNRQKTRAAGVRGAAAYALGSKPCYLQKNVIFSWSVFMFSSNYIHRHRYFVKFRILKKANFLYSAVFYKVYEVPILLNNLL